MNILGIDTSCDDTAAAIVVDGKKIISNVVSSQNEIHKKYGGIVPELASRRHVEMIWPVVDEAMLRAGANFSDISAISVTSGPGLIGSLLVGVCYAKSLCYVNKIPMVSVNHLEGHICSVFLEQSPEFPFIALIASGGHTSLYRVDGFGKYSELGRTRDDAAGEAYDKVAKLLGLGYPGGPEIDRAASEAKPDLIPFPRADLGKSLDFSFSGLKTAVFNYTKKYPGAPVSDIAAGFQAAVIDVLISTTLRAAEKENISRIVLSGGVSANVGLRERFRKKSQDRGFELFLPSIPLCTDNAAMIAGAGYHRFKAGDIANFDLNPKAYMPLGD